MHTGCDGPETVCSEPCVKPAVVWLICEMKKTGEEKAKKPKDPKRKAGMTIPVGGDHDMIRQETAYRRVGEKLENDLYFFSVPV